MLMEAITQLFASKLGAFCIGAISTAVVVYGVLLFFKFWDKRN